MTGTIVSWFKKFISSPAGVAATAVGSSAVTALTVGGAVHGITKSIIKNSMRSIKSNKNFVEYNDRFLNELKGIVDGNTRATLFYQHILKRQSELLFHEGGRKSDSKKVLTNAQIYTTAVSQYNDAINSIDGRVTHDVLEALKKFKSTILADLVDYLVKKGLVTLKNDKRVVCFSDRLEINDELQLDLGLATMICFVNIIMAMYDVFFAEFSSRASISQIDLQSIEQQDEFSRLFCQLILNFSNIAIPILQEGESSLMDALRMLGRSSSERVKAIRGFIKKIKEHQSSLSAALRKHSWDQQGQSLPEGLVIRGDNAYLTVHNFCMSFLVKDFSDSDGFIELSDSKNENILSAIFPHLLPCKKLTLIPEVDVSKIGRIRFSKIGEMGNKANLDNFVTDAELEDLSSKLFNISLGQVIINAISSVIQFYREKKGDDGYLTNTMKLWIIFSCLIEQCVFAFVQETISGTYYDQWLNRHRRINKKNYRMPIDREKYRIPLTDKRGLQIQVNVCQPRHQQLLRSIDDLPHANPQQAIREMIGSLSYHESALQLMHNMISKFEDANANFTPTSEGYVNIRPRCRDVLDFLSFLLESGSLLGNRLNKLWSEPPDDLKMLFNKGSNSVSPKDMFDSIRASRAEAARRLVLIVKNLNRCIKKLDLKKYVNQEFDTIFPDSNTLKIVKVCSKTGFFPIMINELHLRTQNQMKEVVSDIRKLVIAIQDHTSKNMTSEPQHWAQILSDLKIVFSDTSHAERIFSGELTSEDMPEEAVENNPTIGRNEEENAIPYTRPNNLETFYILDVVVNSFNAVTKSFFESLGDSPDKQILITAYLSQLDAEDFTYPVFQDRNSSIELSFLDDTVTAVEDAHEVLAEIIAACQQLVIPPQGPHPLGIAAPLQQEMDRLASSMLGLNFNIRFDGYSAPTHELLDSVNTDDEVLFYKSARDFRGAIGTFSKEGRKKSKNISNILGVIKCLYIFSRTPGNQTGVTFEYLFRYLIVALYTHQQVVKSDSIPDTRSGKQFAAMMLHSSMSHPRRIILDDARRILNIERHAEVRVIPDPDSDQNTLAFHNSQLGTIEDQGDFLRNSGLISEQFRTSVESLCVMTQQNLLNLDC